MWLRFDVARRVFVTAGKQHVRWGTARMWTPTDYLHVRRRNPLDVFDARTGTTMLKLHVPWEARGWNFYAYGVPESEDRTSTVSAVAGAARAEVVLGSSELGAGVFARRGQRPKLALDLSTGIWDFDLYGEVAVRHAGDVDRLIYDDMALLPERTMAPEWKDRGQHEREQLGRYVEAVWPARPGKGWKPQAVGGFTYQRRYHDNDVWTLGGEYFYNPFGYASPRVYPGLIFPRATPLRDPATFFYLGRHYASLFLLLPRPYSWDLTTFTLSTLGNLSDRSYITRLDYSLTVLTHLDFQVYAAVRYGSTEGEFRLGVRDLDLGGGIVVSQAPALLDLGVALRMAF
jgi:hypothetical protein